jgi:hypothetical protein
MEVRLTKWAVLCFAGEECGKLGLLARGEGAGIIGGMLIALPPAPLTGPAEREGDGERDVPREECSSEMPK